VRPERAQVHSLASHLDPDDPLAVARAGAADLLIVKVAPLGGIRRTLDVVAAAAVPAVVSSALESSIGIAMGLHLAAAMPELDFDCGLGTAALLAADVTDEGSVAALRDAVVARFGHPQILINSAGTNIRKNLVDFSLDEFRSVIDSSLISTFLGARAFVPGMMGTG